MINTTMTELLFPIKSKTSCRLKWAWSTLYLNSGKTASCHRSSFGNIDPENFENFHNTSEKVHARQLMIDNKWPGNGCEYCSDIESSGGFSDRQFQNTVPDVYPSELNHDQSLTHVTPVILEVFFSNICNFKCVYCKGKLSSSIQKEDEKFNDYIIPPSTPNERNVYNDFVPKFWKWFNENSQTLMRLQVLGGEPFLQKDYNLLLDYFEKYPHPSLEFNIITNLGVPEALVTKSAERLANLVRCKHLKRVDIQVSIDSWGHSQEYVRQGLDLKLFEKNLNTLIAHQCFRIGLLSTVCSLTIMNMPDLAKKYLEWNQKQEIFWYMHLVLPVNSSPYNPCIFDYKVFEHALTHTLNLIPNDTWDQQHTRNILNGIILKLEKNCKSSSDRQQELIYTLEKIDYRRNLNWKTTFPWLNDICGTIK